MLPVLANAAGTYYTGGYQSPQTRYAQPSYMQQRGNMGNYSQQGVSSYTRSKYANAGYSNPNSNMNYQRNVAQQKPVQKNASDVNNKGFTLGADFSRQTSMWQFEMQSSDSILHYDNIDWNVFGVNAGYVFGDKTPVQISAGFKYGMQANKSTMVDDDITNGGYLVAEYYDDDNKFVGNQIGNALSIGTSKDGAMMAFNAGIGLKDFFKWGNLKVTPSVGWRYLKYSLETHDNYGLSMDIFDGEGGCITVPGGNEVQCDPVFVLYYTGADGKTEGVLFLRSDTNENGQIDVDDMILIPSVTDPEVSTGSNYYYAQPGISHKYDVTWSGPYLALDMQYDMNSNNSVNAFVELGLPSYTATGDQPYRFDWQHPKSVEDTAGLGSAFHIGLGANWTTALSNSVSLSIGLTYDYYTVSGADASTYLNGEYYTDLYNQIFELGKYESEEEMLADNAIAQDIKEIETECPGWVCNSSGEIDSFYKSMGIRVGLNARF
jgi:hypothetical protein